MARKKKNSQTPTKISNRRVTIKKSKTKNTSCNKGLQLVKANHKKTPTSSNDSVIVISDDENEHTENVTSSTQNSNKNEINHSNIDQIFSESKNLKPKVLHTNSANQKPSNNASNESFDDVVEVWSSIDNSSTAEPISDKIDKKDNVSDEENRQLYTLDLNGDSNNLTCLKSASKKEPKKKFNNEKELLFNKPGLQLPYCIKPKFSITVTPQKNMKRISRKFYSKQSNKNKVQSDKVTEVTPTEAKKLREIIIDGCNVAMAYTQGKTFSEKGLKLVIDYFKQRGHSVKVFIPQNKRSHCHRLLEKLWKEGTVVFTPSRSIGGKTITPYDDRFILEYATICKGIVVSLDQYRDLYMEKPEWRDTIENRLLAPTFVGDYIMFPEDPLGRGGPTLAQFLRHDS
ncbi:PREDICTED: probable ribonuclease ZC3H12B [Polistes dominula]|uniref:Probable ribonuclease ZC3H12B n=1 Tax=Polistes dominula TaxID=743375 RepID=A0ABM1I3G8_POLDO|nr:PREDICTED: probable ribonuclease ZC3H12B [Polistes dominula]